MAALDRFHCTMSDESYSIPSGFDKTIQAVLKKEDFSSCKGVC